MKIKELIKQLQKLDGDDDIGYLDSDFEDGDSVSEDITIVPVKCLRSTCDERNLRQFDYVIM